MTRISCFKTTEAANAAINELQNHNIPATAAAEDMPDDSKVTVIAVDQTHLDDAIKLVRSDALKADAIACPECSSTHVVYPNQPEASPTAAIAEKVAEVLNLTDRTFFCHACQHEWS